MDVYIGYIFFPDKPDEIYQSVRLLIDETKINLEIPIKIHDLDAIDIILGMFNGFGQVTLIDCTYCGMESGAGCYISKFDIKYLLNGVQLNKFENLVFKKAAIKVPVLHDWLGKRIIQHNFDDDTISFEFPDTAKFDISNEFDLSFHFNLHRNFGRSNVILEESIYFQITAKQEKITMLRFIELWFCFRKFILFITSYNIVSNGFSFIDDDISRMPIVLHHIENKISENHSQYCTSLFYKNVSENLENILKIWFLNSELTTSIDLILEKSINNNLSRENYFLNICFSIETFHRKFKNVKPYTVSEFKEIKRKIIENITDKDFCAFLSEKFAHVNEVSFKDRLHYFSSDFVNILPNHITVDEFIRKVVKTRNSLVHRASNKNIFVGLDMFWAAQYIEAIVKINIYRIIGVSEPEIEIILNKSKNHLSDMYNLNKRLQGTTKSLK